MVPVMPEAPLLPRTIWLPEVSTVKTALLLAAFWTWKTDVLSVPALTVKPFEPDAVKVEAPVVVTLPIFVRLPELSTRVVLLVCNEPPVELKLPDPVTVVPPEIAPERFRLPMLERLPELSILVVPLVLIAVAASKLPAIPVPEMLKWPVWALPGV